MRIIFLGLVGGLFLFLLSLSAAIPLPIVVLHGIVSSAEQMIPFCAWLELAFERPVYNLEIGNGEKTSLYTPMREQLALVCDKIHAVTSLRNGFDFIGMSQGGLLARGYVEQCNFYPVRNLITLVSPHGGVFISHLNNFNAYGQFIQAHLSFSNYWRDPTDLTNYLRKCSYLSNFNNENITDDSPRNKAHIASLTNFILVWSPNDEILNPPESGKFSIYDEMLSVIPVQETTIYKALGLDLLDHQSRLHIFETNCTHKEHRDIVCYKQLYSILRPFLI